MIEDDVFAPAFGNRPSTLVGRADVLAQFDASLRSRPGSKERSLLLLGQRGSGKTVLLWELAERARAQGYVVASPTVSTDDMLTCIIEKIEDDASRFAKRDKPRLAGGSVGALGFSAGVQFNAPRDVERSFNYKLTHLCRDLSQRGHGVLILVDEVQANSPDMRKLVSAYLELVGEGLDAAMAMAGLPAAVSSTLNDKVLTFLNRARKVQLAPLKLGDVDAYFDSAFKGLGLRVAPGLRRQAAEAVQGSPYMMQLVGHNVVRFAEGDGTVSEAALSDAVIRAREDFEDDICTTTLAALSDQDISFLNAMAADGDGRESEGSSISDVASRMGVTPDYAQKYRRRLLDAGVIAAPRRGRVAFAVPYLADHLRDRG